MAKRQRKDPTTAYAEDVVAAHIAAGKPVRQACERHLRDLKEGKARGLHFDLKAAQHAMDFFKFLRLHEGEFAGKPFELQPFQQFIVGSLFGWKAKDGHRRFRLAYIEIGKGNGKSPLAAGLGLYGLMADDERGAEIYSAAVTREQAHILFRDAKNMAESSPYLSSRLEIMEHSLSFDANGSFFHPVSSEARSLDGKRIHMALIDEIHEHPTNLVVEKIRAGTKGRRNPLIFEITNSGFDRQSICWQHHQYSLQILEGTVQNDAWFAYVCQLDGEDLAIPEGGTEEPFWSDERSWLKVNPCLDVAVTRKYLREQVEEARGIPSKQNIVKRLNFCCWTEQNIRWMPMDEWDACNLGPIDPDDLIGRECYGGLDLARGIDISALVLLFPPTEEEEPYHILSFFWVPKDNIKRRREKDKIDYQLWIDQGLMEATPGNVTDYDRIRRHITGQPPLSNGNGDTTSKPDLTEIFNIKELAIDRWDSTQLQIQLEGDGLTVVPYGQGFASMADPTKQLMLLTKGKRINHGGNAILRWMASNVAIKEDAAGNQKPDKEHSFEKIDGIVALIMAIGRALLKRGDSGSVYDHRGLDSV